jgi:hypothetical protein
MVVDCLEMVFVQVGEKLMARVCLVLVGIGGEQRRLRGIKSSYKLKSSLTPFNLLQFISGGDEGSRWQTRGGVNSSF